MQEEIQRLVEQNWDAIEARVRAGLKDTEEANKPPLHKCVAVTKVDQPEYFRVLDGVWEPPGEEVLTFRPTVTARANELRREQAFTKDQLENRVSLLEQCSQFAASIRSFERTRVLDMLCMTSAAQEHYTKEKLRAQARAMNGRCRLLVATDQDTIAREAKSLGLIDDWIRVNPMPEEAVAVLVGIAPGPIVSRIVDDFTLFWSREVESGSGDTRITLVARQRFFLRVPTNSVMKFVA